MLCVCVCVCVCVCARARLRLLCEYVCMRVFITYIILRHWNITCMH